MTIDMTDPSLSDLNSLTHHAVELVHRLPGRVSRVRVRSGDDEIEVEWDSPDHADGHRPGPDLPSDQVVELAEESNRVAVGAPVVGVFYAAPAPGEPPFVKVGDEVTAGQQVGIVEAMKLMNPIVVEVDGVVAAVHVGDGEPVEFGQRLVDVRPM